MAKPRQNQRSRAEAAGASTATARPGTRTDPKPSRTGRLSRPVHVNLHVDRILKRQWDEALARIGAAKREGASAFDDLWETIGHILEHDPPLYLAGGFATARRFLREHVGETERTAQRLIRVAKYASPVEEAKYGVSKLDAALTYLEAASGGPARGRIPVDFAKLRIPIERGGEAARVPLGEASVE